MAWLGKYLQGDMVRLSVWTLDDSETPLLPDAAPRVLVSSTSEQVTTLKVPITDSVKTTGYFLYDLCLDSLFPAGEYFAQYVYEHGSVVRSAPLDTFEVVAGGDATGRGISMTFFKPPANDYIVLQTDTGTLRRFRNPEVS